MSENKKEYWCNWMIMADSLQHAKDETPKAEWEDIRRYARYSDFEKAVKALQAMSLGMFSARNAQTIAKQVLEELEIK